MGLGLWARWTASNAVAWALVGALVPVSHGVVRVAGAAAWPIVLLGGSLTAGLVLGAVQTSVLGVDGAARTRWVMGTTGGVVLAAGSVPLAALGGSGRVGVVAGVVLAMVQAGIAAPRPRRWRGFRWWLTASVVGVAVLFGVWRELQESMDGWP
jgi:hypothetical protein